MNAVTSVAAQLGIAAGFFLALLLVLWWIGRYLDKRLEASRLEQEQLREDSKDEREQLRADSKVEREQWQEKIEKMNENNTRQLESNGNFQKSVSDAHDFSRLEHEKMVLSLTEVTLTLKGMNGRMKAGS